MSKILTLAVETNGSMRGRANLKTIDSLTMVEFEQFVKEHVAKGTKVHTERFKSYGSLYK